MRTCRTWTLGSLLTVAALSADAQQLRFQQLTTDDGLSDNAITCLYADRTGLLWVGTENGLDRYDGSAVQHVAGTAMHITGVTVDNAGMLWATTHDHGLLRIDPRSGGVDTLRHVQGDPRTIASDQLNCVFDLNDTTLLIGSREVPLIFMDKRTRAFTYWTDSTSLSPARASAAPDRRPGWCHAIVPLSAERLWIGLLNFRTCLVVSRGSGRIEHRIVSQGEGTESFTHALLLRDTLYIGGWQDRIDVLATAELKSTTLWNARQGPTIAMADGTVGVVPWSEGRLLIGTERSGLCLVHAKSGRWQPLKHVRSEASSVASDRVRCLLLDERGQLWVGTANGLSVHNPAVWRMRIADLSASDVDRPELLVHRAEALPNSGVRVFTSEGFTVADSAQEVIQALPVKYNGVDLRPTVWGTDEAGNDLLGTEHGIVRYDARTGQCTGVFEPRDLPTHSFRVGDLYQIRGLWADRIGERSVLVIGTLGYGVHLADAHDGRVLGFGMPRSAFQRNARSLVNAMVRDGQGTYWMGSAAGLYSWRSDRPWVPRTKSAITSGQDNAGLLEPEEQISALLLTGDTLWAVTRSGLLFSVVKEHVTRHLPSAHLRSAMHGLTADRTGLLWITTDNGLLRFDPKASSFVRVPINNGTTFRKLTGAITTLTDGRITLCANNALITFDPRTFDRLPALTEAYITSLSSAGRALVAENGEVELSYRASTIDIGVSAMQAVAPEGMTLLYRLDDEEGAWRSTDARDPIRYAGVAVGRHRLLLKVRDAYGREGPEKVLLTLNVPGAIWQRWWFTALIVALVSTALLAVHRYRLAQALKLQTVRDRIASDLHDEVGSSLSSITIGSKLAAQLSSGDNAQVKEIMARIGETSSESLRSMSDIVWAIDPKNDQGEALVKRMRRIANELLESRGVEVVFKVDPGVEELKLPMNTRKELVLLFKEAVHNASKYSGATRVEVALHLRNGLLALSVADQGRGFEPSLHPDGHGLGSMRRRAEALGARLELRSAPAQGTRVAVVVDLTRIRD